MKTARSKFVRIRVSERELAIFEAMAEIEELPLSTFVRRLLLLVAKQKDTDDSASIFDMRTNKGF